MYKQSNYEVAVYCRLSRDDNNGSSVSNSISNQKDMLVDYVREKGWNVRDIYIDDGYSGTNFDRPEFKRMIKDIEIGKINCVVVKDLSRFGRNYAKLGYYTDEIFVDNGVRFIAINDNVDSNKGDNEIVPFKNVINEWYARDISKKVRSSRAINAKQGKFLGSKPPYGYIKSPNDKHQLIIDENVVDIVKRIFSQFYAGDSGRNIASLLSDEGIPAPRAYHYQSLGKTNPITSETDTWGSNTVLQLVKNRVYAGDMVQGKRVAPSFKSKKRNTVPKEDWIVIENTHEPIVEREIWNTIQERFRENKRTRVSYSGEVSLFSGIVKCAECGSAMAFNIKKCGPREYPIYRCGKYANNGKKTCSIHSISMDTLERIVLEDIRNNARILTDDEIVLMDKLVKLNNREQEKALSIKKARKKELNNQYDTVSKLIKQVFAEKMAGNVPDDMFKDLLADYQKEQEKAKNELESITSNIEKIQTETNNISDIVVKLKKHIHLEKLNRTIIAEIIDSISVSEQYNVNGVPHQEVKINYKFVGCLESVKLCS